MKKMIVQIGDVFCVYIKNHFKRYFQYIGSDSTQLNSNVIKVFKGYYPLDSKIDLQKIVEDEVDFYAHVDINAGFKSLYWEKVGNAPFKENINLYFRICNYGIREEMNVKFSTDWFIWQMNKPMQYVGKLKGENRKIDIGILWEPRIIFERMASKFYFSFEDSLVSKFVYDLYDKKIELYFPFYTDNREAEQLDIPCRLTIKDWAKAKSKYWSNLEYENMEQYFNFFIAIDQMEWEDGNLIMTVANIDHREIILFFENPKIEFEVLSNE